MKIKSIMLLISFVVVMSLLASCSPASTTTTSVDVIASASVVDNAADFEKAISSDGTWIIAITNDLTIDKELVVDGDFRNGRTDAAGNDVLQRKIALYTQDADRNITARFTLTVKKMTIKSANASIQHGMFKGDLYVHVKDFQLIDATVDGNIYFLNEEVKSSFTMDETSKVTGVQEIKAN